jgi:hypothetical protein
MSTRKIIRKGSPPANVSAKTADNPNGQNIVVKFNSDLNLLDSGNSPSAAVLATHEGVHAADGSDWVSSGFSANANPSRFQTERDAYAVGASIYEGLGYSAFYYQFGATRLVFSAPPAATDGARTWLMLKQQYPRLENDAFSRNTRVSRPQ